MNEPAQAAQSAEAPLLEVVDLKQHFPIRDGIPSRVVGHVHAVDGISFAVRQGERHGSGSRWSQPAHSPR